MREEILRSIPKYCEGRFAAGRGTGGLAVNRGDKRMRALASRRLSDDEFQDMRGGVMAKQVTIYGIKNCDTMK